MKDTDVVHKRIEAETHLNSIDRSTYFLEEKSSPLQRSID
jgi:hypothetical protein